MGTPGIDGLDAKINALGLKVGNTVQASTGLAVTASQTLYIDSNSTLAAGSIPFPVTQAGVVVTGMQNTTLSTLNITGSANTDNVDLLMVGQLVGGARVTTFTKTAFIRVALTDSSGVITAGDHYIQVGTLS